MTRNSTASTASTPLGDGRSLLVSTKEGFRVFDAGSWTEPHGDHTHSYTTEPLLTDTVYSATKPGHVVNEGKRTLIFGDGDGSIQELDAPPRVTLTDTKTCLLYTSPSPRD